MGVYFEVRAIVGDEVARRGAFAVLRVDGQQCRAVGLGVGVSGAILLARVLTMQLYEISPEDPWTIVMTALTLAGVALVAAWQPTRRATSVDPMVTLKAE